MSVGTVDRILHNRGMVSSAAMNAVAAALHFLLYGGIEPDILKDIPVDVVLKENLP